MYDLGYPFLMTDETLFSPIVCTTSSRIEVEGHRSIYVSSVACSLSSYGY